MHQQFVTDEEQVSRALNQAFFAGSLSVMEAIDRVNRDSRDALTAMNGAVAMDLLTDALSMIIGDTLGAWSGRDRDMAAANDRDPIQ
jgi:hypothetical protein